MTTFDWPTHLKAALDTTKFMALATRGQDGLWSHAVEFAYDKELNLYFMSRPGTRHMHNIATNGEAAAAVFSTNQQPARDVIGAQFRGTALVLPDEQVEAAHIVFYNRATKIPEIPAELENFLGPNAAWKFVKVTPTEIGYFDTRNFGGERQVVPQGVRL